MATRPALFRQEAIDFLHQRHSWGEVVSLQPISSTILSWSLASLVAFILCFLSIAQYARKETVSGYLTPTFGTAKIFVPQQGFIKELKVKEGQEVAEGDPLLTVVTSQITANGDDVNATVLAVLAQQRDVVERQIAAEERRTASERDRLASTIKGIEGEIAQLEDQREIQNERLKLSESFVSTGATLSRERRVAGHRAEAPRAGRTRAKAELGVARSADHRATHPIDRHSAYARATSDRRRREDSRTAQ